MRNNLSFYVISSHTFLAKYFASSPLNDSKNRIPFFCNLRYSFDKNIPFHRRFPWPSFGKRQHIWLDVLDDTKETSKTTTIPRTSIYWIPSGEFVHLSFFVETNAKNLGCDVNRFVRRLNLHFTKLKHS